jgi:small subunit ribosomal protein S18
MTRRRMMSKYELPKSFDYKNTDLLKQFITETGKIMPARVTGVSASNQRKITKSIKIARFLALLPYTDMHQ